MEDTRMSAQPADGKTSDGQPTIDFLYFEDCPSHERALAMLHEELYEHGVTATIDVRRVETEEEASLFSFPGSPTIRVNGVDIDQNPDLPIGLACRAYRQPNGKISPLPPREKISEALRQATSAST